MKVSLNLVRQFIDVELPEVDELVHVISRQLGSVEGIVDLADKYKDAVIVRVVSAEKIDGSDHLSVTFVDDGGKLAEVDRNSEGYIQVVCGAPNVKPNMLAIWLPPNSIVPSSYGTDKPFVLGSRKLRGYLSHGMLAASDELGFDNNHETIIEVSPDEPTVDNQKIIPGASFAKLFGLDDTIIEIENKMFTHRPDLFGQLGVAREISAILTPLPKDASSKKNLDTHFENPDWYFKIPRRKSGNNSLELSINSEDTEKIPRFMAVAMNNVVVRPSSLLIQSRLVALGSKPINNIVDITNYIMLITAQPMHAYDYDKLAGNNLTARMAKDGEKAVLLNGKEYELSSDDIVIADGDGPVGLGGVMGGFASEVTKETKNIVLEAANFDMYSVRRTSMRYGLFTDAVVRYTKGQSILQISSALTEAVRMLEDTNSATQASEILDTNNIDIQKGDHRNRVVSANYINDRLGLDLTAEYIGNLLRKANFVSLPVDGDKDKLDISEPWWRTDISEPEDIVEEVGRLYGFDKLPLKLPIRTIEPVSKYNLLETKKQIRQKLAKFGASEVLTFSFVNEALIDKSGQNPANALRIVNALSPDLQYYRLSLLPSLLEKVHLNIKSSHDEFALFEMGKRHSRLDVDENKQPNEINALALVVAANDKLKNNNSAYYLVKKYLQELLQVRLSFKRITDDLINSDYIKPFDINRSALVYIGDDLIGVVGEFRAELKRYLKLPNFCAGFEIDVSKIIDLVGASSYVELSNFPGVSQDITLKVSAELDYSDLYDFIYDELERNKIENTYFSLEPIYIYSPEGHNDYRQVTFRFKLTSRDRTLTDKEVNGILEVVAKSASNKFQAERV